ncbi:probable E3 ubiquitin-protein ligase RNF144A-B isoform X2 [Labeo rohita]|uniref:probable E3 ubiquitin-protein ligase RNF144A-B isoform X2 n=1 Tax=Labeo rohita TaxID=84645 RepID=UPI0021E3366D|nr:probable E3 ubiquitin-protein ligase RNF144A-B isoform X2 [Labeo rohita]
MGAGNSQVSDLTSDLSQEDIFLKAPSLPSQTQSIMNNQSVNTSGSQEGGNHLDPTNTSVKASSLPSQTQLIMNNQSVNTSGSQEEGSHLDPTNTCPVCVSALKPAYIKGSSDKLLQCTQCPTAQLLCGSCLYPCTSAACTNTLCPLVATLLTCEVVSDPKSKVLGCPMFRACPKCHTLIMHEEGCKFVRCRSCRHRFCFIC